MYGLRLDKYDQKNIGLEKLARSKTISLVMIYYDIVANQLLSAVVPRENTREKILERARYKRDRSLSCEIIVS